MCSSADFVLSPNMSEKHNHAEVILIHDTTNCHAGTRFEMSKLGKKLPSSKTTDCKRTEQIKEKQEIMSTF